MIPGHASSSKHLRWLLQTQKISRAWRAEKTGGLKLRCSPPILPEDLPAVDLADYHRKWRNWAGGFFFSWCCCSPHCTVIVCWSVFGSDPFLAWLAVAWSVHVGTMRAGFTSCSFHDPIQWASEAVKVVPIGLILDRACGKVRFSHVYSSVDSHCAGNVGVLDS